jgi:hypothetical protein
MGFIDGLWNGLKVEFGKVYSNPFANAFKSINEADEKKKLRVFDFDDTLVKTKSHIYITDKDGKKSKLTPGEYAIYEPKDGDNYDFSDFEQVKQPQEIKGVTKLLKTVARAEGERKVVILTARAAYKPVKDYLQDIGLEGIYVVALASNNPQDKADWIEDKIKAGYNDVFFIDDSHKNISAVNKLKEKYPNIKMKVSHVKHDVPALPKQSDMKSQKDKETTKKVEPKKNDMSLKALLPKRDLDKTIKNPETGNKIKIKTALGYDKTKPAYKAAQFALKQK